MRLKPTPLFAVGAAFVVLIAAFVVGNWVLSALVVGLLVLVAIGAFVPSPTILYVKRHGLDKHAWTGQEFEVEVEFEAEGTGLVALHDVFPDEFELTGGNTYRLFWVSGRMTRTYRYKLVPWKRGEYEMPPTRWRAWHAMHMKAEVQADADNGLTTEVMPKPAALPYLALNKGRSRLPPVGTMLTKVGVSNNDFRDVRSYSYGDPIKSINWKASARRLSVGDQTLLTNQYESEGRNTVWLFVDCSAYMMVGNNLRNPMEVLAHLVTGASQYFLKRGYRVGLFPYGSNTAPLSPGIGRGQLMRISAAMRDLEPAEKAAELDAAIEQVKIELVRDSSSAVVFARLDMPDNESLFRGVKRLVSLRPRIRAQSLPLVIGVGGYLFIDADDWYERNGVLLMDMATRPLVRSLRKMGVRVLEWRPSDQPDWSEVAQEHARTEASA